MRLPRRVLALAFAVLTATTALPAHAATAAPGVQEAAGTRMSQPCPSMAGELLTRPGYPWYVVDKDGYLRGIPPGVPDRLFTGTAHLRTDVPLESCALGEDLSSDAALLTASDVPRPWFLYTKGFKYGISPGMPGKYRFDGSKLRLLPASVLDAIPDGGLWA